MPKADPKAVIVSAVMLLIGLTFGFAFLLRQNPSGSGAASDSTAIAADPPKPHLTQKQVDSLLVHQGDSLLAAAKDALAKDEFDEAEGNLNNVAYNSDFSEYVKSHSATIGALRTRLNTRRAAAEEKLEELARRSTPGIYEPKFLAIGYDMRITVSGTHYTTITFQNALMGRVMQYQMTNDTGLLDKLREAGFKKAVFTNGYDYSSHYNLE